MVQVRGMVSEGEVMGCPTYVVTWAGDASDRNGRGERVDGRGSDGWCDSW